MLAEEKAKLAAIELPPDNKARRAQSLPTADEPRARHKPLKCNACGGALILMTEISEHHYTDKGDLPGVRYFQCEACAHIRIVEEQASSSDCSR